MPEVAPPDPLCGARRILVYGVTGSGKTVVASRISGTTGIPWTSVDDLTWEPGWTPVAEAERRRRMTAVCARDDWILDTAYGRWLDVPLGRADLVVALDFPRWFSLQRLVRRTLRRVRTRQPVCNGNVETWSQVVSGDSIIWWHFRSFARKRRRIRAWCRAADQGSPRVLRFTTQGAVEDWLGALQTAYAAAPAAAPSQANSQDRRRSRVHTDGGVEGKE